MRPAMISTMILALLLTVAAGGCFSNAPVTMKLRPAGEVGTQFTKASGPDGEPALEIVAGPTPSTIGLLSYLNHRPQQQSPPTGDIPQEFPDEFWSDFVVRGKMKYSGPAGPDSVSLDLSSELFFGVTHYDLVEHFGSGDTGWHEVEVYYHGKPGNIAFSGRVVLLTLQLKMAANAGKLTVAELLVVTRLVKSGDEWEEREQLATLSWRFPQWIYPHANPTEGPAGEPALNLASIAPSAYTLAVSERPQISSPEYAVRGRVRCDNYSSDSYLELLSDFGDAGIISTRCPFEATPNSEDAKEWRAFELPVHCPSGMTPKQLTLKAFLQSGGIATVCQPLVIAPLTLPGAWWSASQAGWIGGGWAALIITTGCLAGLSSALTKPLLTVGLCGAGWAISGTAITTGVIALCVGQTSQVCLPLLVVGGTGAWVFTYYLRRAARQSQTDELRRMTAADVV